MAKPTGFLEQKRKEPGYRPVEERVKDYKDVARALESEDVRVQASRCMDCSVPFCHSIGGPLSNLIPEWNDLVYHGRWEEALKRLEKSNPFPEITGRICPAPCETSCTLSINDSPVTIRQVELAIIEYGFARGLNGHGLAGSRVVNMTELRPRLGNSSVRKLPSRFNSAT